MQSIRAALKLLIENRPLETGLAEAVAREILEGQATPAQMGAFLTALRLRGEKPEHLLAFARVMRGFAQPVPGLSNPDLVDTCGTGGDGASTFNISTAAAFVAAGAGAKIAKHGNRAVSGVPGSGSADVLAALGVNIECPAEVSAACIAECGFGFFFAPAYHSALRHAAVTRREIGIRTILNLLGPLANPAGAARQVVGVSQPDLTDTFAQVFAKLGAKHVLIVYGHPAPTAPGGLDEISLLGPTQVSEVINGHVAPAYEIIPEKFGLTRCVIADLAGAEDPSTRADQIRSILSGERGPRRDIVLLNAAAALIAAGIASDWIFGLSHAAHSIDSGAATRVLENLIRLSQPKVAA